MLSFCLWGSKKKANPETDLKQMLTAKLSKDNEMASVVDSPKGPKKNIKPASRTPIPPTEIGTIVIRTISGTVMQRT